MWNYFDQIVKKSYAIVILLAIIPILVIPVLAQESVNSDSIIPHWVKGVANFWVEDKIDDAEFAEALEFLIDSDIIQLDNNIIQADGIVIVPEQEIDWEEKYNTLLKEKNTADTNYSNNVQKMLEEHSKVSIEMDEEYNAMMKRQQIAEDENKKEWRETYNKISEENAKLKTKIKELEK